MAKSKSNYKATNVITDVKKIEMTGVFDLSTGMITVDGEDKNILNEISKLGDGEVTITAVVKLEEEKIL